MNYQHDDCVCVRDQLSEKNFRQGCYFDLYCNFLRFDKIKITKGLLVVFVDKDVLLKFILSNISQNM